MNDSLLAVRGLRMSIEVPASAEERDILLGVDLEVSDGEALALVGESGSGKSMTARSIMRLLPEGARLSGSITFQGESVLDMDSRRLRSYRSNDISIIFQEPAAHIDPTHTIGDFLIETLRACCSLTAREAETKAVKLLDDVKISNAVRRMSQYPHELSGGMLQRVMIASALAPEPALLLADEPTTALDVTVQSEVVRIISELRRERQVAMLFITHDLELAELACDRMAVVYAGRVVEVQEGTDIAATAVHPYTIGLVSSRPKLNLRAERLPQLPGRPLSAHEAPPGCAFAERCRLALDVCRQDPPPAIRPVRSTIVACHRAEVSREVLHPLGGQARPMPQREEEDAESRMLIVVDGVRRVFGTRGWSKRSPIVAVDDVSFTVRQGESVAIVGESGSGKTTMARLLVGLDRPTAGTITIAGHIRNGRRLVGLSRAESASKIQIVFQDPYTSLDPRQTIGSSIKEALRRSSRTDRVDINSQVMELMERVGLATTLAGRYPRRLSGGQRQRVAIARALALDPEVLVLDEAVASLDVSIQAQILNLLADLRREMSATYVFITHDLAVVRQVADRVLVMHGGRVIEHGSVDQILEAPETDYTRNLIASIPARLLRTSRRPAQTRVLEHVRGKADTRGV